MPLEIERRWLIEADIEDVLKGQLGERKVEQSYIVDTGGWVQRIRVVIAPNRPTEYYLTMKRPAAGFSNHEIEFAIEAQTFRELEQHTGPTLIKQRHYIAHGPLTIEVDVYRNVKFNGLIVAEVELPAADTPFEPPAWFGREITSDRAYSNFALAKHLTDDKSPLPWFPTPDWKQPAPAAWVKS